MHALRLVGRGILSLLSVVGALLIMILGLALLVGFWFGINWALERLGIPIRILPRL